MTVDIPNIKTPNLDKIEFPKWFTTKYNFEQLKEIDNLIENHLWITAKRQHIFVKSMTTKHIQNCIRCFNGEGNCNIPENYLGGKEKWIKIFQQELLNRQ